MAAVDGGLPSAAVVVPSGTPVVPSISAVVPPTVVFTLETALVSSGVLVIPAVEFAPPLALEFKVAFGAPSVIIAPTVVEFVVVFTPVAFVVVLAAMSFASVTFLECGLVAFATAEPSSTAAGRLAFARATLALELAAPAVPFDNPRNLLVAGGHRPATHPIGAGVAVAAVPPVLAATAVAAVRSRWG